MTPAGLRFAVIGTPIAHSKSPAMHHRAYEERGLAHEYVALDTAPEFLAARIGELRSGHLSGINVTVPHKKAVLALVDVVEPSARDVGAANTLLRDDAGKIHAFNTDALALRYEIERLVGDLRGASGLVIGDGGAARAAVSAMAMTHAARIDVRARAFADPAKASAFVASFPSIEGLVPAPLVPRDHDSRERDDLRVVIQATSCGMDGGPPADPILAAVHWPSIPKRAAVIDVVYKPRETAFLRKAREAHLVAEDGLRMLALQGALAFQLWLGGDPPFEAMLAAVLHPSR